MQLEPRPRHEYVQRVTTKLITSSNILHFSTDEFERAVCQEQIENPALEVHEQRVCLFCGSRLYSQTCTVCGHFAQITMMINESPGNYETSIDSLWNTQQKFYDFDNYGFAEIDREDEADPLASIPTGETLAETLLLQLEALITPGDEPITEQLVGNLNERGYLEISVEEIAQHLEVPVERIEYVLSQLHTLEPLGIGARNPRECLLIQLQALSEQETPHPLAYILIDRYLGQLARNQFTEIARELKVSEQEVRQASLYIRTVLYPFPALTYRVEAYSTHLGNEAAYVRPDVVIRKGETGFELELIEKKRYQFSINTNPADAVDSEIARAEIQRYIHHSSDRAKFFIDCVQRRWHTLSRVTELVVAYQHDFLERGVRYMHPLTRAEVAAHLNLDEGTVSRAIANKYALLPNGRLMPLSDFFDGSLRAKDVLRELIASEEPKRRLSDEELARLMQVRGIPMARRTVTKYREEMGMGSSRERG
ncbi:MAG: RNA polymerase factor sigma-54 [Ktedonobacteraceae bacterium]